MTTAIAHRRWFLRTAQTSSTAPITLLCLPYAGRGASAFRTWNAGLADVANVVGVQLPGRESRFGESADLDPDALADAIASSITGPYLIYGHSLGGRLGYEVVARLADRGASLPRRLLVGGSVPVDLPNEGALAGVSREPDAVIVERLGRLGGLPPEVLAASELLDLLMPAIRGDFSWIDNYRWSPRGVLPVPITAVCGTTDAVSSAAVGAGWSRHSAPDFRLSSLVGGHFFLHSAERELWQLLRSEIDGTAAEPTVPSGQDVDLWFVPLPAVPDPAASWSEPGPMLGARAVQTADAERIATAATSWLGPGELARASRLRFDRDRRRYLTRCLAVHRILQNYGIELKGKDLPTDERGKPMLPGTDLTINWSHSEGVVLVGIAHARSFPGGLGVDVERVRTLAGLPGMQGIALHPDEPRTPTTAIPLPAADPDYRASYQLLALWTAKEALLKATGDGLQVEPATVSFAPLRWPDRWPVVDAGPRADLNAYTVLPLRLPGSVGAVCSREPIGRISLREFTSADWRGLLGD